MIAASPGEGDAAERPVAGITAGARKRLAVPLATALGLAATMAPALAQGTGDAATIAELRRQLNDMQRQLSRFEAMQARLDQLEARVARQPAARAPAVAPVPVPQSRSATRNDVRAAQEAAREARAAADEAQAVSRGFAQATAALPAATAAAALSERTVAGLEPPEPMGRSFEDALRADLPGVAFRVPGTDTQVRLYGFAKVTGHLDLNGRNQSDAPLPGGIPLRGSPADQQGGEFTASARFSRFGVDTRTLTSWGTLETRIEGDFGGGTSANATFRLRQAWAELGTERFAVLAGQANSLWNEGLFETIIDATNLNQSFIRQAQIRVTARLGKGLTGQFSIEAPETQYTAAAGVFNPSSTLDGGASPAFNVMPDFLARLTYRSNGIELGARGMVRQLQIRPAGTAAGAPSGATSTTGWGLAAHARLPMRLISESFGPDELVGMAYYGEGIGRYFAGSTNGQDALSNIGMANVQGRVSLDATPAWGATLAYRRFWNTQFRSNFAYSYARQDFPSYALDFTPGSAAALSLNREVQQGFANLIWSPFAEVRNGVFGSGWLDVGLEYLYTRRDIAGGAAAAGAGKSGYGVANRFLFGAVARF
ncbi:DcaP family trimeric outer membrane transporter [Roseococcus pinisoli]|uniref:Porin n=1 Tax=Roseococcus pinisoli TaxID=2835040 RepID=A0ABS5QCK2_9PROT|nr:porin [Roseococcus pinisoli]